MGNSGRFKKQTWVIVTMVMGGGLLLYDLMTEHTPVYLTIAGLVLLMAGLYTASRSADNTTENPEEDEDQHS